MIFADPDGPLYRSLGFHDAEFQVQLARPPPRIRHIPGVDARLLDDDGHLTLLAHRVPEVHVWLSDHLPDHAGRP